MGDAKTAIGQGSETWNAWRDGQQSSALDVGGANLEDADLRGANLRGVRLDGANMFNADLTDAVLDGASLRKADLRCVTMERVSAVAADFEDADLRAASLAECDFTEANCHEARLKGAEIFECDLGLANFKEADLSEAVMSGCSFDGALFGNTSLAGARLWEASGLSEAEHEGPSWLDPVSAATIPGGTEEFLRGVGWPDRLIENWRAITAEGIAFYSCFISYSQADMVFARRLHDALQDEGIRCWLDRHALLPGDDLRDRIDEGIKLWDKVVLCCSRASLTSWWVDQEIERALQKEERLWKERGEKILALVPVRLDDFVFDGWESGKKATITSRYVGDFRDWSNRGEAYEQEFEKLVRALSSDPLARGIPPSPKL